MNFAKFLRTPFLQNTSGRLLLILHEKDSQNLTLHKQSFTDVSEISIFKNLAKLTRKKKAVLGYLFEKVAGPQPGSLLKKIPPQIFFCEFCEIFKNSIFIEHFQVITCDSSGHYLKIYPDIILKTTK